MFSSLILEFWYLSTETSDIKTVISIKLYINILFLIRQICHGQIENKENDGIRNSMKHTNFSIEYEIDRRVHFTAFLPQSIK